jgi:hypothetical protein
MIRLQTIQRIRPPAVILLTAIAWLAPQFEASQAVPSDPTSEKVEALFQQSANAYGGETKILSLQDGCYDYSVEAVGKPDSKPLTVKACFKTDEYFRSEASGDNLEALTILNQDRGWVRVDGTVLTLTRKEIDPVRIGIVIQLRPDLLLVSFPKRRYAGQKQEDGRTLELVDVSGFLAGEYVRGRLAFDTATHLIYKYEYETEKESPKERGIVKGEERYVQYKENEGLKVPKEILSRQGSKTSRLILSNIRFDPNLDPGLFEDPSGPSNEPSSGKK